MGGSNVQRGNAGEGGSDWSVKEGLRAVFVEAVKGAKIGRSPAQMPESRQLLRYLVQSKQLLKEAVPIMR
jgi:hypothetical protein